MKTNITTIVTITIITITIITATTIIIIIIITITITYYYQFDYYHSAGSAFGGRSIQRDCSSESRAVIWRSRLSLTPDLGPSDLHPAAVRIDMVLHQAFARDVYERSPLRRSQLNIRLLPLQLDVALLQVRNHFVVHLLGCSVENHICAMIQYHAVQQIHSLSMWTWCTRTITPHHMASRHVALHRTALQYLAKCEKTFITVTRPVIECISARYHGSKQMTTP